MSEQLLRFIPTRPDHVPSKDAQAQARMLVQRLLPRAAAVAVVVHDTIAFMDPGANFEAVLCPFCHEPLALQWWHDAMSTAAKRRFADLFTTTPCCERKTSLNDLEYRSPAGFARFAIEVRDPGVDGPVDPQRLKPLEEVLGGPLRQVLARY